MPRGRPKKIAIPVDPNPAQEAVTRIEERAANMPDENLSDPVSLEPTLPVTPVDNEQPQDVISESSSPAEKWKRDDRGLLVGVDYIFNDDGTVNWVAMIPKRYFVINKQATGETDIDKVEDRHKLILLAGFKWLATLRGYTDEHTEFYQTSRDYVSATTSITWMPNYETSDLAVTRSGSADAHDGNVSTKTAGNGFKATNFLMTIAENRSLVRAVKNMLNISVLGQDEVSLSNEEGVATSQPESERDTEARNILQKLLDDNKLEFEQFKNGIKHYVDKQRLKDLNPDDWEVIDQIPSKRLFEITEFMKARFEERRQAAAKK